MTAMQRNKGQTGEREIAALVRDLTGWDVRRRVRQHDGDSDLDGVPGWSVEVKRHRTASRGDLAAWWRQSVAQAGELLPVLFYRVDRADWRAVWPLSVALVQQRAEYWSAYDWTADTTVEAWAAAARNAMSTASTDAPARPESGPWRQAQCADEPRHHHNEGTPHDRQRSCC